MIRATVTHNDVVSRGAQEWLNQANRYAAQNDRDVIVKSGDAPAGLVALYDFTNATSLHQDSAGTTPVTVVTDPIGNAGDQSVSNAPMLQATTTTRPLYATTGAVFDAVDDSMTATFGAAVGTDCTVINSIDGVGYQVNTGRDIGATYPLNIDSSKLMLFNRDLTATELALVARYCGTEKRFMMWKQASASIANMRCYTGGGTTNFRAIGADGGIYNFSLSAGTTATVVTGLVAPIVVVVLHETLSSALTTFRISGNNACGTIPDFSGTNISVLYLHVNRYVGAIPALSACPAITDLLIYSNQLTGYAGGAFPSTLGNVRAENNLLTVSAVDALLAAAVAGGRTSAMGTVFLNLGGTGNATPSAAGLTDKATLVSRGWTVTTN